MIVARWYILGWLAASLVIAGVVWWTQPDETMLDAYKRCGCDSRTCRIAELAYYTLAHGEDGQEQDMVGEEPLAPNHPYRCVWAARNALHKKRASK